MFLYPLNNTHLQWVIVSLDYPRDHGITHHCVFLSGSSRATACTAIVGRTSSRYHRRWWRGTWTHGVVVGWIVRRVSAVVWLTGLTIEKRGSGDPTCVHLRAPFEKCPNVYLRWSGMSTAENLATVLVLAILSAATEDFIMLKRDKILCCSSWSCIHSALQDFENKFLWN